MKNLGELRVSLGIEFAISKIGILMHQRKYTLKLILETEISGAKPAVTPLYANVKLTTKQFDDHTSKTKIRSDQKDPLTNRSKY